MGNLASIEFFAATVESGSFASAARKLGVTASAVSRRVAQLERELGVPLLSRTTRSLSLTNDGRAFHERCVRILEELREAHDAMARASTRPSGLLRVDAPFVLAQARLTPHLPAFLDRHPEIRLELTLRDQFIDPNAEGIDVLVRIGPPGDSALMARRLGSSCVFVCGAPSYLAKRGTPESPKDLAQHDCLGYLRDGRPDPWRFVTDDGTLAVDLNGPYHSNDALSLRQAAVAGKGLVALFDFMVAENIEDGALVRVLENHRTTSRPIHALYPKNRHLLPKVRVFLDFLSEIFQGCESPQNGKGATFRARARSDARTAESRLS